jgi:hypothetical protein
MKIDKAKNIEIIKSGRIKESDIYSIENNTIP